MRIEKVILKNIGPYKYKEFLFSSNFTVIVDKNETGKSTLANSIFEALYPSKTPVVPINNGEIFIQIKDKDDIYQISRNQSGYLIFKNGNPLKYETKTKGRVVKKSPGEILFNLTKEVFQNSCFLMQKSALETKQLYPITSFLESAIDTGFEGASASLALKKIEEALYESIHSGSIFPFKDKGKLDNAIKIWNQKLTELNTKRERLTESILNQKNIIEDYTKVMEELEELNKEISKTEKLDAYSKIYQDDIIRKELYNLNKRNNEIQILTENIEKLSNFHINFEKLSLTQQQFILSYTSTKEGLQQKLNMLTKQKDKTLKLSNTILLLNFFIFLLTMIAGFLLNKAFFLGLSVCTILSLFQIQLSKKLKKIESEISTINEDFYNAERQISSILSIFQTNQEEEFFSLLKEYLSHREMIREYIENLKKIEELEKSILSEQERAFYEARLSNVDINFQEVKKSINYELQRQKLLLRKEELTKRIYELQRDYEKILDHKKQLQSTEEEIEKIINYLQNLNDFKEALQISYDILKRITQKQHENWAEKLNSKASELLSKITGRPITLTFNKDLSFFVKIPEIEFFLNEETLKFNLSGGVVDQIYFTIRVIISQILSKDKKIPLILDEPFAHSDDERFINAMKYLMNELSNQNQIIVLSCHNFRLNLIRDLNFELISVN